MKYREFGRGLPVGMACLLLAMVLSPAVAAQQATPSAAAAAANQAEVAVPAANQPAITAPAAKHLDLTHVLALLRTQVPDLGGKTEQEARSLLASPDVDLVLKVTGNQDSSATPGTILSQTPAATTQVLRGSTVEVTLAQQLMPQLIGVSVQQAALKLRQMELPVRISEPEYSTQFAAGVVSAQDPAVGTPIYRGDSVNRTVVQLGLSKGPPPVLPQQPPPLPVQTPPPANQLPPPAVHELRTVPDLGSLTQQQAEAVLLRAGLRLGAMTADYSDSIGPGLILGQAPAAGTRIDPRVQDTESAVLSRGAVPSPPRRLWPLLDVGVGLVLLAAAGWLIRKWLRPKLPVRITAASHRAPATVTVRQSSQRQMPDVRLRTRLLPGPFRPLREPQIQVSRDAATGDQPRNQQ